MVSLINVLCGTYANFSILYDLIHWESTSNLPDISLKKRISKKIDFQVFSKNVDHNTTQMALNILRFSN